MTKQKSRERAGVSAFLQTRDRGQLHLSDLLFSLMLALSLAVGSRIVFTNGVVGSITETAITPVSVRTVALFVFCLCVTMVALGWARAHEQAVLGVFAGEQGEAVSPKSVLRTASFHPARYSSTFATSILRVKTSSVVRRARSSSTPLQNPTARPAR